MISYLLLPAPESASAEILSTGAGHLAEIRSQVERAHFDTLDVSRFFEISLDLFAISSRSRILRVGGSWTEVLGWTEQELTSRDWVEFLHPDDASPTVREVEHMTEADLIVAQNRWRTKSGGCVLIDWRARAYPDDGSGIFKLYATGRVMPSVCGDCVLRRDQDDDYGGG